MSCLSCCITLVQMYLLALVSTSLFMFVCVCAAKNGSNRASKTSKPPLVSSQPKSPGSVMTARNENMKEKTCVTKNYGKNVGSIELAKTQECDEIIAPRTLKKVNLEGAKDTFDFQKKAVDDGIVLHPCHVRHMGNIDDIAQILRWPVFTGRAGPSISSTRFVPSPLSSKMFSNFVSDVDEVLEPYPAELSAGPSV
ncbi:hypothetical protein RB195_018759 [Necator americanus]|uniref:Uncharacterized protein n=1 Tax=Necator americanus TaxID=51031 RepID=A0ABR1CCT2_NECAM